MKIICEKGYHAGNVLRLVAEYLEKRYPDDMILDDRYLYDILTGGKHPERNPLNKLLTGA